MKKDKMVLATLIFVGLGGGVYLVSGSVAVDPIADTSAPTEGEMQGYGNEVLLETVSAEEFAMYIEEENRVRIDVRTPEEYTAGHVANSHMIDFYAPDFTAQLEALDRDTPYAIYCRSGNRSGQTLVRMRTLGFTNVVNLGGGIGAWATAGQVVCTDC